jgi:hypothetical protein
LRLFEREFHLSERDAAALLASSTHLLGKGDEVNQNLAGVLRPSKAAFTDSQAQSAVAMVEEIAAVGGSPSRLQSEFVEQVRLNLLTSSDAETEWS